MSTIQLSHVYPPHEDFDFVAVLSIFPDHPGEATVIVRLTKDQLAQLSDDAADVWGSLPHEPAEKSPWPEGEQSDFRDESRERAEAISREGRKLS